MIIIIIIIILLYIVYVKCSNVILSENTFILVSFSSNLSKSREMHQLNTSILISNWVAGLRSRLRRQRADKYKFSLKLRLQKVGE